MLYTASLNRKDHHHGLLLDVTVKSARPENRVFAPTWALVMASKRGEISWAEYTEAYVRMLRLRWAGDPQFPSGRAQLLQTARTAVRTDTTLLCYCREPATCHRSLLADVLVKIAASDGLVLDVVLR